MNEYEKNYIECRLFILGDRDVGKKAFIEKLISVPSTSLIRNIEAEKEFNMVLEKISKENEQQNEYYMNLQNNKFNSTVKENYNDIKKKNKIKSLEKDRFSKTKNNFDFNNKFLEYNPNNIEGKKNKFIMKSFIENQVLINRYRRPPIPEYPAKLFNINKSKIILKPFYIFPAEDLPDYYNNSENNDEDFIIEGDTKISLKGIFKDINKKLNMKKTIIEEDKLSGYKIFIYNLFIFIYDLSNFASFENLIIYYDKINKKYDFNNNDENFIACIIGNKKDKKLNLLKEQENKYNEFIKNNNNSFNYEISTKPFFNFDKFFYDFFLKLLIIIMRIYLMNIILK